MFEKVPKPKLQARTDQRATANLPTAPARAAARPRTGFASVPVHAAAPNRGNLPGRLKSGIEALSGMPMDGIRVHYNSARPKQLDALALAQGREIHLAPGQAHHLPHEAWHIVQQAQGRVKPTIRSATGEPVNDDHGLEREADRMGAKAARGPGAEPARPAAAGTGGALRSGAPAPPSAGAPVQAMGAQMSAMSGPVKKAAPKVAKALLASSAAAAEYEAYKSRNPGSFNSSVAPTPITREEAMSTQSEAPKTYYAKRPIDTPRLPAPLPPRADRPAYEAFRRDADSQWQTRIDVTANGDCHGHQDGGRREGRAVQ